MKERVFVVVVSFNGGEQILQCVESVKQTTNNSADAKVEHARLKHQQQQITVVVVDNNSTDKSLEKIKNEKVKMKNDPKPEQVRFRAGNVKLKIIKNKENLGFSGGVNRGIKYALKNGAEYMMLLNQDAVVEKGAIEELVRVIKQDKRIGICGPLVLNSDKSIWSAGGIVDKKRYSAGHIFKLHVVCHPELGSGSQSIEIPKQVRNDGGRARNDSECEKQYEVEFISGCAMMIKKQVFEKIGFFDEPFFLYYEDADFCFRAKKAGFKSVFVPQAVVYHYCRKSADKEKNKQYFMARNHLLFLKKHAPLKIKIREMIRLPKTIYEHLSRGEIHALLGIKDYFLKL